MVPFCGRASLALLSFVLSHRRVVALQVPCQAPGLTDKARRRVEAPAMAPEMCRRF